jgi:hypothetical protein
MAAVFFALHLLQPRGLAFVAAASLTLLMLPIGESLSERIALTGCVSAGVLPALWLWPFLGAPLRQAWLPLLVGCVALYVSCSNDRRSAFRRILPRIKAVDLLPVLGALVSIVMLWRQLQVSTPKSALLELLSAWDNGGHFNMVAMLIRHGATIDRLPPSPDGSEWAFAEYPQGFHTLLASIMEGVAGHTPTATPDLLPLFVQGNAVLTVIGLTVLIAAICSVPVLRCRPGFAMLSCSLVFAAYVLGPGAVMIRGGFENFWLACVLVACTALISISAPSAVSPVHAAAASGAVSAVSLMWLPLLTLAVPAALLTLFPKPRAALKASARDRALSVLAWCLALCLVGRAVQIVSVVGSPLAVATTRGGILQPSARELLASVAIAIGGSVLLRFRPVGEGCSRSDVERRISLLGSVPLLGLFLLVALAVVQISAAGELSYYFFKYGVAVELVSWVAAAVAVATLAASLVPARRNAPYVGQGLAGRASLAVASLGLTQAFGHGLPSTFLLGDARSAPTVGLDPRPRVLEHIASDLLDAAASQPATWPTDRRIYLSLPPYSLPSFLANQWYCALTRTWTQQIGDMRIPEAAEMASPRAAAAAIDDFRERYRDVGVIVPTRAIEMLPENYTFGSEERNLIPPANAGQR